MKEAKKKRGPIFLEPPFLVGLTITIIVFAIAGLSLGVGEVCNSFGRCVSKWEALRTSPPNEIGDSLAGFAGTLAFVWLIVTVWLQATELREQREEFEKMADAQEAQVKLLVAQGQIFEDERQGRRYQAVTKLFERKLERLCVLLKDLPGALIEYLPDDSQHTYSSAMGVGGYSNMMVDDEVRDMVTSISKFKALLLEFQETEWQIQTSVDADVWLEIVEKVDEIEQLKSKLPPDEVERLNNINLLLLAPLCRSLIEIDVWGRPVPKETNA